MQDTSVALKDNPQTPVPIKDKPKRLEVRGKLRHAIDAMIWEGLEYDQAAKQFNFGVRSMRDALSRPHVLAYLRKEREVLRASVAPKNIHRLREIRDADNNMPAVNAIKVLEQIGDEQSARAAGATAAPGVTIRIVNVVQAQPQDDKSQHRSAAIVEHGNHEAQLLHGSTDQDE